MFDIIVAMTKNYGIGNKEGLAWKCPEELKLFKQKTKGNVVVMGRKTIESLPHLLPNRTTIAISRKHKVNVRLYAKANYWISHLDDLLEEDPSESKYVHDSQTIFIAGGAEIYNRVFKKFKNQIRYLHVSIMKENYPCDTFIDFNPWEWIIEDKKEYNDFTHYVLSYCEKGVEQQYLSILKNVLDNGIEREGRNGITKSVFSQHLKIDLREGFPLFTTKKMFLRGVIEELLFFIRGETDTKKLEEKGVYIWQGNSNREFLDKMGFTERQEGIFGPLYGWQWRHFGGEYNDMKEEKGGFDQLKYVVELIQKDPYSRRIMMTTFNPAQAQQGVLYPCHGIIFQFYVEDNFLDCSCYNRSQDLFLGTSWNIASSALFLCLIAKITGKIPRYFNLILGDSHIYQSHYEAVKEQLSRIPNKLPKLEITEILDIEKLTPDNFILTGYNSYPAIKAKMIA